MSQSNSSLGCGYVLTSTEAWADVVVEDLACLPYVEETTVAVAARGAVPAIVAPRDAQQADSAVDVLRSVWLEPTTAASLVLERTDLNHLWHAMRRVEATLAPGKDAWDAFSALFPAGSVTGAPRVAAMEIIRALEPCPRGVYCGTVGWFGERAADLNVAIRTISFLGDEAHVQTGSGIVLASDPARELAEAKLKAERLLAAL